jgi:threonine dehydratase
VAYAARQLFLTADVFLPAPMNPVKAAMIAAFGATLHEVPGDIDEAKEAARQFAAERDLVFLDDGEDVAVLEGAGTLALEVVHSMPDVECLVVPMGGGNLCAGCATALAGSSTPKLFSVQSSGAPAVTESFRARTSIERPAVTIADGLVTRIPPKLALGVLWKRLDDAWLVSDEDLLAAVQTLAESAHVLVEPAGAAVLAGAWRHRERLAGKRVVLVLSGANITLPHLRRALDGAPLIPLA